jgi:hypothetical protein
MAVSSRSSPLLGTVNITGAQLSMPSISPAAPIDITNFQWGTLGAQSLDERNPVELKGSAIDG